MFLIEFIRILSKEGLERLRVNGVPLPNLAPSSTTFELINLHHLDEMLPGLLTGSFCSGDFLYVYLSPWHVGSEYENVYDLIVELNASSVYWNLVITVDAPNLDDLFLSNTDYYFTAISIDFEEHDCAYYTITNFPQRENVGRVAESG
jgi:hypothetical protein